MANGYNQVILLGNLAKEPELRRTGDGNAVCTLRLAVNDYRRTRTGEVVEETTFADVAVFGRQAEAANESLVKGSRVFVQARLRTEEWTGRDGAHHSALRIAAQRIEFLDRPAGSAKPATAAPAPAPAAPAPAPGAPAGAAKPDAGVKPGDLPF